MIKTLLDTIGIPVAKDAFIKDQDLPHIVFTDSQQRRGADVKYNIIEHSVTIYLTTEEQDEETEEAIETLIETNLTKQYEKSSEYSSEDGYFRTTYEFDFVGKR